MCPPLDFKLLSSTKVNGGYRKHRTRVDVRLSLTPLSELMIFRKIGKHVCAVDDWRRRNGWLGRCDWVRMDGRSKGMLVRSKLNLITQSLRPSCYLACSENIIVYDYFRVTILVPFPSRLSPIYVRLNSNRTHPLSECAFAIESLSNVNNPVHRVLMANQLPWCSVSPNLHEGHVGQHAGASLFACQFLWMGLRHRDGGSMQLETSLS